MGSVEDDGKQNGLHFSNVRCTRNAVHHILLCSSKLLPCLLHKVSDEEDEDSPGEQSECLLPYVRCALQHMLAGAVAGTLEHTLMFPIDTIKTRMQALSHPGQRVYTSTLPELWWIIRALTYPSRHRALF